MSSQILTLLAWSFSVTAGQVLAQADPLAPTAVHDSAARPTLYLIPGTGADERLFHQLDLSAFDTVNVRLPVAGRKEDMTAYAARVAETYVDTTRPYGVLGVSLGGMVATEWAASLQPEFVVIVASAKTRRELPAGYRMARYVPVYRLVGGKTMRWFTRLVQPAFEPMEPEQRDLFIDMIYGKDPRFLQRAVGLMVNWRREDVPAGVTHVHGESDRTLPLKRAAPDYCVRGEGHMLTYSRPEVVEWALGEAVRSTGLNP